MRILSRLTGVLLLAMSASIFTSAPASAGFFDELFAPPRARAVQPPSSISFFNPAPMNAGRPIEWRVRHHKIEAKRRHVAEAKRLAKARARRALQPTTLAAAPKSPVALTPAAMAYAPTTPNATSKPSPAQDAIPSLMTDPTLRPGDAYMGVDGLHVVTAASEHSKTHKIASVVRSPRDLEPKLRALIATRPTIGQKPAAKPETAAAAARSQSTEKWVSGRDGQAVRLVGGFVAQQPGVAPPRRDGNPAKIASGNAGPPAD